MIGYRTSYFLLPTSYLLFPTSLRIKERLKLTPGYFQVIKVSEAFAHKEEAERHHDNRHRRRDEEKQEYIVYGTGLFHVIEKVDKAIAAVAK